jgi:3-hydroxybutyryl-CoA dehydrogenase
MQILAVGNVSNLEELKQKFGRAHTYMLAESKSEISTCLKNTDVIFDFDPSEETVAMYSECSHPIFLNSVFTSLTNLISKSGMDKPEVFFGFCGLPTFVNRSVLEVSVRSEKSKKYLEKICSQLETEFVCVEDRIGFITPRVIFMIINEAYYTLEEGTATRADIDLAMKLGTNYPWGPFEWARRIGISVVIKLLDAVYKDTSDARYTVCNLLRTERDN